MDFSNSAEIDVAYRMDGLCTRLGVLRAVGVLLAKEDVTRG